MDKKFSDMTIPEKIGAIIACVIFFSVVGIILFAIISKEMSLWDVICWFMSAIGWYMIAIIVGAVIVYFLVIFLMQILPFIAIIFCMLGLYIIFSNMSLLTGIIFLIIAVVIFVLSQIFF